MPSRRSLVLLSSVIVFATCSLQAPAETVNSFRRAQGLPALRHSSTMQTMAQRQANSMASRRSMDHDGFITERGPAGARAENVAWGCATESCAVVMWIHSSGHRANMLLTDVATYGLASAESGGRRYWCLELGN
jgi:uncharacterized protein YkwD